MSDPFTLLGVAEDADDATIRQRYLALVRAFPPDREPERFQAYRAAYQAVSDQRKRLEAQLLQASDAALTRLKLHLLKPESPASGRASKSSVAELLVEGVGKALARAPGGTTAGR
jgi:curved DNA-binding protein CbpA